jgi:hypothetical protein
MSDHRKRPYRPRNRIQGFYRMITFAKAPEAVMGFDYYSGTRDEFEARVLSHPDISHRHDASWRRIYWRALEKCRAGADLEPAALKLLVRCRLSEDQGELLRECDVVSGRRFSTGFDWCGGALQCLVFGFVEIVDTGVPLVPRFIRLTATGRRWLTEAEAAENVPK